MFKMTWNFTNNSRDQFKKKIQKNIFGKFFLKKKYFFEKFLKFFFDKFWKKKITNHLKYFMATKLLYLVEKQAKNNNYSIGQNFSKVHANARPFWPLEGLNFISGHELCLIFEISLKIWISNNFPKFDTLYYLSILLTMIWFISLLQLCWREHWRYSKRHNFPYSDTQ